MKIDIKYEDGVEPIVQAHAGEWYDLRAAHDVTYKAEQEVRISLGVAMRLPTGYEAIIKPRSSTVRKYGLIFADSGVIDNAYCGDNDIWQSTWYAIRYGVIHKNDRICQFRIQPIQETAEFRRVNHLDGEDRGGYGSTGAR